MQLHPIFEDGGAIPKAIQNAERMRYDAPEEAKELLYYAERKILPEIHAARDALMKESPLIRGMVLANGGGGVPLEKHINGETGDVMRRLSKLYFDVDMTERLICQVQGEWAEW